MKARVVDAKSGWLGRTGDIVGPHLVGGVTLQFDDGSNTGAEYLPWKSVSLVTCRVCGAHDLFSLWHVDGFDWFRCTACRSDTNTATYAEVKHAYGGPYFAHHERCNAGRQKVQAEMRANFDWWERFRPLPDNTFLDVGSCEGCGLDEAAKRGWSVHGFDVFAEARLGAHVTIAPEFRANLFPRQYSAVNCREVLEHVEDWRGLLLEMFAATLPGGMCQVQTPRPIERDEFNIYQCVHLQLFTPHKLCEAMQAAGWVVADAMFWELGQAWMLRKPRTA